MHKTPVIINTAKNDICNISPSSWILCVLCTQTIRHLLLWAFLRVTEFQLCLASSRKEELTDLQWHLYKFIINIWPVTSFVLQAWSLFFTLTNWNCKGKNNSWHHSHIRGKSKLWHQLQIDSVVNYQIQFTQDLVI